jgi:hypothetical protein
VVEGDSATIRVHPSTFTEGCTRQQEGQKGCLSPESARLRRKPVAAARACGEQTTVCPHQSARYLVQDHEKHAKAAGKLFDACDRGEVVIVVLPAVLAECVFVLESFYENSRGSIASALGTPISSPGVEINDATIHLDALTAI